jgi:Leucine-rich repeat (LRR) protein
MNDKFPIFKFNFPNSEEYQVITEENSDTLAEYMRSKNLKKLIVISDDDAPAWNSELMPDLSDFSFLDELLVYWTNISDIEGVHHCVNLKTLWLDNDDKTAVDFSKFPYLEKFISWSRKNIENIWRVSTLKELTLAGLKRNHFQSGAALKSIEKLRILKTPLEDISFLIDSKNVVFLELLDMSKIENLTPLRYLTKLKHLRITANKVKDFSFIRQLVNLETLYITSKVAEFEFDHFTGLNNIKKINISGNPQIQMFNKELSKIFKIHNS